MSCSLELPSNVYVLFISVYYMNSLQNKQLHTVYMSRIPLEIPVLYQNIDPIAAGG